MANSPLGAVLSRLRTILEPGGAEPSDRELLGRFVARREEAAFGELVRRHGPMVLGVCRRILGDAHAAEDAFQAVFLVLVRRARAVPWRESLGGWLHGAARRVALRAKGRAARGVDADRATVPSAAADPSEEAAARELRRVLDQELQGLPAKLRAPLVLCDMEGKTHEQAARELGWPKGSLAKRLNGAREQLRARLLRRGVALSAGALAAFFTANEVMAAPPVALAAAALLAAEGGASTTATALAKGVVQAMWLTKIKTAAVLMLALALAGAVAGGEAYRAWGVRAAAPAPAPNPAPQAAEDKDTMPVDKAVVYHVGPVQGVQTDALPAGAVIAADRPESVDDNVHLYLTSLAQGKKKQLSVPAGPHLAVLAVGPVLNSGDEAVAVSLERRGEKLDLEMAYTSGDAEGKVYKRNVPWRPLVQVPVDLAVGRRQLTVTWQARKTLPAGDAWNVPPVVSTCAFDVVDADRTESKAVRVEGLEFTALAPARVAAPSPGGKADVDLGLRIANVSDRTITVWVSDVIRPRLVTADGKELKADIGRDGLPKAKPPETLGPGESWTWRPEARLSWTNDRAALMLSGPDGRGVGGFWSFTTLHPGKYRLVVEYSNANAKYIDIPVWVGKAATEGVDFEIAGP